MATIKAPLDSISVAGGLLGAASPPHLAVGGPIGLLG